jgi:hypothetical protein
MVDYMASRERSEGTVSSGSGGRRRIAPIASRLLGIANCRARERKPGRQTVGAVQQGARKEALRLSDLDMKPTAAKSVAVPTLLEPC